jgi:hypothetical protein
LALRPTWSRLADRRAEPAACPKNLPKLQGEYEPAHSIRKIVENGPEITDILPRHRLQEMPQHR